MHRKATTPTTSTARARPAAEAAFLRHAPTRRFHDGAVAVAAEVFPWVDAGGAHRHEHLVRLGYGRGASRTWSTSTPP
jgi:hypothetical protein